MGPNSRHVLCFFCHVCNEMMVHDSFHLHFHHLSARVHRPEYALSQMTHIHKCEFILNICFVLSLLLSFLSYSPRKCSYLSFITTQTPHLVPCQVARGLDQTSFPHGSKVKNKLQLHTPHRPSKCDWEKQTQLFFP